MQKSHVGTDDGGEHGRDQRDPLDDHEADLLALKNSPVPLAVYGFENKRVVCVLVSVGFVELFGHADVEAATRPMNTTNMYRNDHPDDVARIADEAFRFATEGGAYEVVYRTRRPHTHDYMIVHSFGRHVFDEDGKRYAIVWYVDEGDWNEGGSGPRADLNAALGVAVSEANALHRSYYDGLTGLPNMAYFLDLAAARRDALASEDECAAMLYLDLIGMKTYNRRFGFDEGDNLIRSVAHVLAATFGNESCGRVGQDHFCVVCPATGVEDAVRDIFGQVAAANGGKSLPVRVGIYLDELDPVNPGEAFDRAKIASDEGRGSYVSTFTYFDNEMLAVADRRTYVIDNLDRALAEGWIEVHYQPIVRTTNGRVCDEEALARWIDPERGMLSSAEFIGVLEEAKLIHRLDLNVVEQVLDKMRRIEERGLFVVPCSVNLSRSDFEACDIVEEIRKRVDAAGIPREKITVEITESAIGSDYSYMKRQVERFHELGFSVWMDDFGSEYSSLDYLQSLAFDLIKLDMRFMRQFAEGEKAKVIITEIVRMALSLDIDTVCEGVETAEQVAFLREIGCSKLQGFYFSRPNSLAQIFVRYDTGTAIGFENPDEAPYFHALGAINLYDLASVARSRESGIDLAGYFDTLPMAVLETDGTSITVLRANSSFLHVFATAVGPFALGERIGGERLRELSGTFLHAVDACREPGVSKVIDDRIKDGSSAHVLVRHVALNAVTGNAAVATAVLDMHGGTEQFPDVSFGIVAQVLAADYRDLYYVDLATERFVQYACDAELGSLAVARRGTAFFACARDEARASIYLSDLEGFLAAFTRDNVTAVLDASGTFTLTYRLMIEGCPTYMSMKTRRVASGDSHIIIGVSNVDAEMRARELERRQVRERAAFGLAQALFHDLVCIYAVDPDTLHYREYDATADYSGLKIPHEGEDFFVTSFVNAARVIAEEDLSHFNRHFTRQEVFDAIGRDGFFELHYRLALAEGLTPAVLRAVMIDDEGRAQLVVSVSLACPTEAE